MYVCMGGVEIFFICMYVHRNVYVYGTQNQGVNMYVGVYVCLWNSESRCEYVCRSVCMFMELGIKVCICM